jgi:hypothetical protein
MISIAAVVLLACLFVLSRFRALSSLTSTLLLQIGWTAQKNLTGDNYAPNSNQSTLRLSSSVGTTAANAAVGGGDELASSIVSIAGAGTATIDLTAMTEITGATGISFARVKGILFRLLNATLDATNGTAAASVTLGNNAANDFISQAGSPGYLGSATSTLVIPNGGAAAFAFPAANGVVVDATHKLIKVTNNDPTLSAKLEATFQGGSS